MKNFLQKKIHELCWPLNSVQRNEFLLIRRSNSFGLDIKKENKHLCIEAINKIIEIKEKHKLSR